MNLITIADAVLEQQQQHDYAGYDPFDGLNSLLFQGLQLHRSRWLSIAWLQANKVLPINLRPLFRVPRMRNPKGVALFILGLLEDYKRTRSSNKLKEARRLADWLLENTSDKQTWQHACWGYHFDWQARAFYVPKGKPNIISTSYIASALHELHGLTHEQRYQDTAIDTAYFVTKYLASYDKLGKLFFAYIPGEKTFIHNASLWGAATVARAAALTGDKVLTQKALQVAQLSVDGQQEEGAWVYGSLHHHQFVDGFHTGFNLEALDIVGQSLQTDQFNHSIKLGLNYYRKNFFLQDGTPKYYNTSIYPIDMHSSAQAILTFGRLAGRFVQADDSELMKRIMTWTVENMYLHEQGSFRYQINKRYRNNVNYVRWTQAWAYYALAYYIRFMAKK